MARRGRPPHPDILTPRQWEVLGHLREGLSNPEIAEELGITRAGAKFHVAEILGKLAVSSREEAALWQPAERRRRWATALAPLGWVFGHIPSPQISLSGASAALAGGAVATGVAGIGLIAYLLVQGGGVESLSAPSELVQAQPTPTATPLPSLDEIDAIGAANRAKGRFEGKLGDFLVLDRFGDRTDEALVFGCGDVPYTFERNIDVLRGHELWAEVFGADGNGLGCEGQGIHNVNNEGDEGRFGTGLARFYLVGLPMPVVSEAPRERLELIEVEGHPALLEHPLEGFPFGTATITIIERYPDGYVPGIVVRVLMAPSSEEAIALAEELMP